MPLDPSGFCPSQVEAFQKRFGHTDVRGWFGSPVRDVWMPMEKTYDRGEALTKNAVWFGRFLFCRTITEAAVLRKAGVHVVLDLDDWLRAVPSYNPNQGAVVSEQTADVVDALGPHLSAVSYSTAYLGELYTRRFGELYGSSPPGVVLPNCLDLDTLPNDRGNPFAARHGRLVVGWSGSPTHRGDLDLVAGPLDRIMQKWPEVWFAIIGAGTEELLGHLPRERRIRLTWDGYAHLLPRYTKLIDVGIAPLLPSPFNSAKSNIKALEYGVVCTPCIASNLPAYSDDPESPTVLVDSAEDWYQALDWLIGDPQARAHFGDRAATWARDRYSIQTRIHEWADMLLGLDMAEANKRPALRAVGQPGETAPS